jgi:hypothetical protein
LLRQGLRSKCSRRRGKLLMDLQVPVKPSSIPSGGIPQLRLMLHLVSFSRHWNRLVDVFTGEDLSLAFQLVELFLCGHQGRPDVLLAFLGNLLLQGFLQCFHVGRLER